MKQKDHYRQILRLVSGIGRLTNPQHLAVLEEQKISLTQFLVLDVLNEAKEPLRMAHLAEAAGLPAAELTRVIAGLEGRGSVSRTVDPEDSRAKLVSITRDGKRLLREVEGAVTSSLRSVWEDFTHDEWHRFIDLLQRFETGLRRVRARRQD